MSANEYGREECKERRKKKRGRRGETAVQVRWTQCREGERDREGGKYQPKTTLIFTEKLISMINISNLLSTNSLYESVSYNEYKEGPHSKTTVIIRSDHLS